MLCLAQKVDTQEEDVLQDSADTRQHRNQVESRKKKGFVAPLLIKKVVYVAKALVHNQREEEDQDQKHAGYCHCLLWVHVPFYSRVLEGEAMDHKVVSSHFNNY